MTTKNKLVKISLSIAIICLALVLSVVGILAAGTQNAKTGIQVTYTAKQVSGTVTYQMNSETQQSHQFKGSDTNTEAFAFTQTTQPTLSADSTSFIITYTFTNAGDAPYTATLTLPSTMTNVTTSVKRSTDSDYVTYASTGDSANNVITINANTTTAVTYLVKVELTDVAKNASVNGDFAWALAAQDQPAS